MPVDCLPVTSQPLLTYEMGQGEFMHPHNVKCGRGLGLQRYQITRGACRDCTATSSLVGYLPAESTPGYPWSPAHVNMRPLTAETEVGAGSVWCTQ